MTVKKRSMTVKGSRQPVRGPCGSQRPFARAVGGRVPGAWGGWRYRVAAERRQGVDRQAFFCLHGGSPADSADNYEIPDQVGDDGG